MNVKIEEVVLCLNIKTLGDSFLREINWLQVVRFNANDDRFNLNCNRNLRNDYPAFRIVHLGIFIINQVFKLFRIVIDSLLIPYDYVFF